MVCVTEWPFPANLLRARAAPLALTTDNKGGPFLNHAEKPEAKCLRLFWFLQVFAEMIAGKWE